MSGTFKVDGEFFPINPIKTKWKRTQLGFGGGGVPVFAPYWQCEMEWSYMTTAEKTFFYDRWAAGGYHVFVLPHPRDDEFTLITGTTIITFESNRFDVTGFSENPKMTVDRILITGVA